MAKTTKDVPVMSDEWQVQADADTLSRAAEIVADQKRLAKAQAYLEKRSKGVDQLLSGLRRKQ